MNDRPSIAELHAFLAIVRRASFRAAADEIGLSPSSLSHMMRALEERLGVRLFHRTTRSVAPTEAGARLARSVGAILGDLDGALAEVSTLSGRPGGRLRINASVVAVEVLLERIVPLFVERHPEVDLDLVTEGKLVDVVADGFDAGARLGESLPQDMIAVPFGGDARFVAVASRAYVERAGQPRTPDELAKHHCIRFRLPSGKMHRWELERKGDTMKIDVPGSVTLDDTRSMVRAAIQGIGIAYVPHSVAARALARGEIVTLLDDWTPPFAGMHLYYPSHRLVPSALRAFVDVMREVERERVSGRGGKPRGAKQTSGPRPPR